MSALGSSLAHDLVQNPDDDVLHALQLYYSFRPDMLERIQDIFDQGPLQRYSGEILSFNEGSSFGFIRSEEAKEQFDKDVYCSRREMADFRIGDVVTFTVVLNKKNQPQARLLQGEDGRLPAMKESSDNHRQVEPLEPSEKRRRVEPMQPPEKPRRAEFLGPPPPMPPPAPPMPPPAPDMRMHARAAFGNDAPPMPPAAPQYPLPPPLPPAAPPLPPSGRRRAGQRVDASEIVRVVAPSTRLPPPPPPLANTGQRRAGNPYPTKAPPRTERNARFVGSLVHFNVEKNFGFISSPAITEHFGKDVYISNAEIGTFKVGDVVSVEVVVNKKGQPQARNPQSLGDHSQASSSVDALHDSETRFTGCITTHDEKRFGFIQCPETHIIHGKDVFVHSKEMGDFQINDRVTFRLKLSDKGQPQAWGLELCDMDV